VAGSAGGNSGGLFVVWRRSCLIGHGCPSRAWVGRYRSSSWPAPYPLLHARWFRSAGFFMGNRTDRAPVRSPCRRSWKGLGCQGQCTSDRACWLLCTSWATGGFVLIADTASQMRTTGIGRNRPPLPLRSSPRASTRVRHTDQLGRPNPGMAVDDKRSNCGFRGAQDWRCQDKGRVECSAGTDGTPDARWGREGVRLTALDSPQCRIETTCDLTRVSRLSGSG
jgi:hypothetical protein